MTGCPLDVLFVGPDRFLDKPQIGEARTMAWDELAHWLSHPSIGEAKNAAGAWSPARYEGNIRRKPQLIAIGALVVDVDQGGDVDAAADALAKNAAIVHETFSSTPDAPRCRIVFRLAEPTDVASYEAAHKVVRAHLARAGFLPDESAKDASRLSYAPVRCDGTGYRFRRVDGAPLDVRAVLAAQPPPPPRVIPRPVAPDHQDRYIQAALRNAAGAVSSATPGMRHYALCRESFALARLEISEGEIERALLPAFIAAAGDGRLREGERTIRDAVAARRGGA